jgi:hypothetical protein
MLIISKQLVNLFFVYIFLIIIGTATLSTIVLGTEHGENEANKEPYYKPQVITMDNLDDFMDKLKYADGWADIENNNQDYKLNKQQEEKLKLIEKINDIPPNDLAHMLKTLGYDDVNLGEHQSREIRAKTKKDQGQWCETTTRYHTSIAPENADVFMEEDSAIEVRSTTGDPVACACDEFDCVCRKQCFCKVQAEPFVDRRPAPACKKCVNCDGSPTPTEEEQPTEPERPAAASFEFKCSCSFDGSGGDDEPNKSAMDCDCKVSDCKCTRKCKCRQSAT